MSPSIEPPACGAIGLVAALPGELKPLVVGWQRLERNLWLGKLDQTSLGRLEQTSVGRASAEQDRLRQGSLAGPSVFAIASGMGRDAATRGVRRLLDLAAERGEPLTTLVSVGWAGALRCSVRPPAAHCVSEVVDTRTGERFATGQPEGLRLVTLDRVAGVEEKRRLSQSYSAQLVDMEAATVARLARLEDLRFLCYKAVSDSATERLPDFSRFMNQQGGLRMPAFLGHVALRPGYWANLVRMGANSKHAAQQLARLLCEHLPQDASLEVSPL